MYNFYRFLFDKYYTCAFLVYLLNKTNKNLPPYIYIYKYFYYVKNKTSQ